MRVRGLKRPKRDSLCGEIGILVAIGQPKTFSHNSHVLVGRSVDRAGRESRVRCVREPLGRVTSCFSDFFFFLLSFPVPSESPQSRVWSRVRTVLSHFPSSLGLFRTSHDTSARPSQFCCLLHIVHELKGSVSHTACDLSCARIMQAARVAPVPLLTILCDATHSPWSHG